MTDTMLLVNATANEEKKEETLVCQPMITPMVQAALDEFGGRLVSNVELGRFIGMDDDEIKMMELFWEPAFNRSEIYLSPMVITNHLGYVSPSSFYKSSAFKAALAAGQIKPVAADHPLVVQYKQSTNRLIENKTHSGGKETSHYITSGKNFKKVAMAVGTTKALQIHEYFTKVEELAMIAVIYINVVSWRQIHQQLASKDAQLAKQTAQIALLQSPMAKIEDIHNEKVYIVSSSRYWAEDMFKFGKTGGTIDARLAALNTSRTKADSLVTLHTIMCHNAKQLEKRIHYVLQKCRDSKDREFFRIPFTIAVEICETLAHEMSGDILAYNTICDRMAGVTMPRGSDVDTLMAKIAGECAAYTATSQFANVSRADAATLAKFTRIAFAEWRQAHATSTSMTWKDFKMELKAKLMLAKLPESKFKAKPLKEIVAAQCNSAKITLK